METPNVMLENEILPILTSKEYGVNPHKIHNLKISELRTILKYNKKRLNEFAQRHAIRSMNTACKKMCNKMHDFTLVGNKCHLKERVETFFRQDQVTVCIQKCVRGYFVREMNKLHGPARIQRGMCMNTTDFCTLEPLEEISHKDFFSYTTNNITYGFDINSLLLFIKKRKGLKNPYMRENMNHCIPNILKLHRFIAIVFPNVINQYQKTEITRLMKYTDLSQSTNTTRRINTITLPDNYNSAEITQKIRQIRDEPIESRIRNVFMEMDNLGNYTDHEWFSELSRVDQIRFFRIIRDIWNYRSRMPYQLKLKICPLWDPFITSNSNYRDMSGEDIAKMCVNVMEDMVYMGIDTDSRILGTFQVLTALTFVSTRARIAMPWLYESLF